MVNIKINGNPYQAENYSTIVEAANLNGIHIPTLCYLKNVNAIGACRVCLVETNKTRGLVPSCVTPVSEGMEIITNSPKVRSSRKTMVELLLSNHDKKCLTCTRNQQCELQALCDELGIDEEKYAGKRIESNIDEISPSIVRDNNKCILCRRCVAACNGVQKIGAIGMQERGMETNIGCAFGNSLADSNCVNCGQCIIACPVGALYEKDSIKAVQAAIDDPTKHVVIQAAPSVRAALGEEFGMPMGTNVAGKMIEAMRRLGVDKVFDTNFAADLTIMEEGTELIERISGGGVLPMITSCSPGWVKFCEHNYHDMLPHLSTCKSPHEMGGAIFKSYYAEKAGIDPKDVFSVSVMPCTAKKYEAQREEMAGTGYLDVDAVITTRELAKMIKQQGIDFTKLPDGVCDDILGEYSGAGTIFGVTGGVMEAALRTVADVLTGEDLDAIEYTDVRGLKGVKQATLTIAGMDIKIAVAHGIANAQELLNRVRAGETYHFIEIMCCPGGCVTGGGQPRIDAKTLLTVNPKLERAKALYSEDEALVIRKSHKNPSIIKLYADYLEKPGSHKAHTLLHTYYTERPKNGNM